MLRARQISRQRFRPFGADLRIDNRNIRNKAIAAFRKSLDKSWILSRVTQGATELPNCDVEGLVEIPETLVGPDSAAQLLPGNDFPRMFQKYLQQFQRLLLHSDSQTRFAHFARLKRNLKSSE